jgi:tetratricopeptide (TPR) repeat protein
MHEMVKPKRRTAPEWLRDPAALAAEARIGDGRLADALATARVGLRERPASGDLWNTIGLAGARLERFEDAQRWLLRSLTTYGETYESLFNLALIAAHLGDGDAASKYVERAIDRDPSEVAAWRLKAALAAALEHPGEAEHAERTVAVLELGRSERTPQVIDRSRVIGDARSSEGSAALKPLIATRRLSDPGGWDLDVDRAPPAVSSGI